MHFDRQELSGAQSSSAIDVFGRLVARERAFYFLVGPSNFSTVTNFSYDKTITKALYDNDSVFPSP